MTKIKRLTLFIIISVLISCQGEKTNISQRNDDIKIKDTITTSSGLQYFYLKKGNGTRIEMGSEIKCYTDLYKQDPDTLAWTTSTDKDSVFKFILEEDGMIEGFIELNRYLVEGDEVVAILPDSLAYGKKVLVFNPYIVKSVSNPKINIADTLFQIVSTNTVTEAIAFYETVRDNKLNDNYHTNVDLIYSRLFRKLKKDSLYAQTISLTDYFEDKTEDPYTLEDLRISKVSSLVGQGKIQEAIIEVEQHKKEDDSGYWENKLIELKEKIK